MYCEKHNLNDSTGEGCTDCLKEEIDSLRTQLAEAKAALADCRSGLVYIRETHGELYGVGFDRAIGRADAALSAEQAGEI